MNQHKFTFSLAWIAALLVATPAMGQLLNHPVMALPAGPAEGSTFVGAEYGRGLNGDSGKLNSVAGGIGSARERVSFMGMGGYVVNNADFDTDEVTLAVSVAVHLLSASDMPVQVSLQGGAGWVSQDFGTNSPQRILNFPIGIAISTVPSDSGPSVRAWVMPRLNIVRSSDAESAIPTGGFLAIPGATETDIVAGIALQDVVAIGAVDVVVAAEAKDVVRPAGADQGIVELRPDDQVWSGKTKIGVRQGAKLGVQQGDGASGAVGDHHIVADLRRARQNVEEGIRESDLVDPDFEVGDDVVAVRNLAEQRIGNVEDVQIGPRASGQNIGPGAAFQ